MTLCPVMIATDWWSDQIALMSDGMDWLTHPPIVNLSHLRLMKSGQTAVKSTSTSPLRSGYEPLPTLNCTN